MGVSYDGTSAEMLATALHPAVKADIPSFSLFDTYADVAYPGGVHLSWFTENWARGNDVLDRNAVRDMSSPWWVKLILKGVKPVDDDTDGKQLVGAVASHAHNWNTHDTVVSSQFRDDRWAHDPEMSIDHSSPHTHLVALEASGTAVYSYGGWLDAAYPLAAIRRYLSLSNPDNRLVIGPWNHGGTQHAGPQGQRETAFDHLAEQIRFFDTHLKGVDTGIQEEEPIHYYTMGAEKWKAVRTWPPKANMTPFYFYSGNRLSLEKPQEAGASDRYRVDCTYCPLELPDRQRAGRLSRPRAGR